MNTQFLAGLSSAQIGCRYKVNRSHRSIKLPFFPILKYGVNLVPDEKQYDVFLSHNSRDKPSVEKLAHRLEDEKNLKVFLDKWHLVPGNPWQDALEEAINDSRSLAVFIGPSGIGSWEHEEMRIAIDKRVKQSDFRVVPVLLQGATMPEQGGLPPTLARLAWVDFRNPEGENDAYAFHCLVSGILGIPPGPDPNRPPDPVLPVECPYRGLKVFDEEHSRFFFGRDAMTQHLVEALRKAMRSNLPAMRFLAVLGPSGSGKSSVVRAGLLPKLRAGSLPSSGHWRYLIFKPGADPLHKLASCLTHVEPESPQRLNPQTLRTDLESDHRSLHVYVHDLLARQSEDARCLILVDQFEEVFTLCRDDTERRRLIDNLRYAATVAGGKTVIVITMRADFLARAAEYTDLAEVLSSHQFLVSPMEEADLRRAIEEPAKVVGLSFEPGLVETLLNDAGKEPGALPLLEDVLQQLYNLRTDNRITSQAYREIGGVSGALAKRAESIHAELTPDQQNTMRRVMLQLAQPGEGTEDTRRRVASSELWTRPEEKPAVEEVLAKVTNARLITMANDGQQIEIAHEALIRKWERLKFWLNETREFRRWRQSLDFWLKEWHRSGHHKDMLLHRAHLIVAKRRLREREGDFNEPELDFIKQSENAVKRRRRLVIGAALLVVLLSLFWFGWSRSNKYQISSVLSEAPGLMVSTDKESVIVDWVRTLALANKINESLAARDAITYVPTRSKASIAVAEALALIGQTDKALDVSNGIEDQQSRSQALITVVATISKKGNRKEALIEARKIDDPQTRHLALSAVVTSWIEMNMPNESISVAHEIKDLTHRALALISVAQALAQSGKPDEALAAARTIKNLGDQGVLRSDPFPDEPLSLIYHVQACVTIAHALTQIGRMEEANRSLDEAIVSASEIYDPESQSSALANVAVALMKAGRAERAERAAEASLTSAHMIKEFPVNKCRVFSLVADVLMKVGKIEKAKQAAEASLTIAREIKLPRETAPNLLQQDRSLQARSLALVAAAEALNKVERKEEAKQAVKEARIAARRIENSYFRFQTVQAVIAFLIKMEKFDDALMAACEISGGDINSQILSVFSEMKDGIDIQGSGRLDDQTQTLIEKVRMLVAQEKVEEAKRAAEVALAYVRAIAADDLRSRALASVAKEFAKLKSFRDAREIAALCPLSNDKLDTYITILIEHAKEQNPSLVNLLALVQE